MYSVTSEADNSSDVVEEAQATQGLFSRSEATSQGYNESEFAT